MFKKLSNSITIVFITNILSRYASAQNPVQFITLDPGHFHAALVQNKSYANVNPTVHVYAPTGPDLQDHLKRIESYNKRPINPTQWTEKVYEGLDYLEKMLSEKKGNVLIISGNNQKKTEYILKAAKAGLNILADKPMCIDIKGFLQLKKAFEAAQKNNVLLYDIMTERSEITTLLQKELSQMPEIFGSLKKGTLNEPAIEIESVHHFYKYVSGSALKRPAWFMDVAQQGEGIVDVTSHLVDLAQWAAFPDKILSQKDVQITAAKHWPTQMNLGQFTTITGLKTFPDYLKKSVKNDTSLQIFANGEISYKLRGIHTKVRVLWNYSTPVGGDTHYAIMKGTKSHLEIRQGKTENFTPQLFINKTQISENELLIKFEKLQNKYPGIALKKTHDEYLVVIPDKYRTGHEAHFGEVMERFLEFQVQNKLPEWEVPNMLVKYYITTQALELAKKNTK